MTNPISWKPISDILPGQDRKVSECAFLPRKLFGDNYNAPVTENPPRPAPIPERHVVVSVPPRCHTQPAAPTDKLQISDTGHFRTRRHFIDPGHAYQ